MRERRVDAPPVKPTRAPLIRPNTAGFPSVVAALVTGWSPEDARVAPADTAPNAGDGRPSPQIALA